ncbi:MAG: hypothetical protein D6794_10665, partial [Deltaproteobacteria bacterium]
MLRICLTVFVLLWPVCAGAVSVGDFQLRTFAAQVSELVAAQKIPYLTRLFHMPDGWSQKQQSQERAELGRSLQQVFSSLGGVQLKNWTEGTIDADIVWVEGLNADYWREHSRF